MLVVPEVFSSFLPLVLFLHLVILREKNGGVFKTILLFNSWQSETRHGGEECPTHA